MVLPSKLLGKLGILKSDCFRHLEKRTSMNTDSQNANASYEQPYKHVSVSLFGVAKKRAHRMHSVIMFVYVRLYLKLRTQKKASIECWMEAGSWVYS